MWVRCTQRRPSMAHMRFLLMTLRMTQGSGWHDDLDQSRRHIIYESRNKPVPGQGGVRASAQQHRRQPLREDQ